MNNLYNVLQQHISENQPSLDDRESVLNLLYETYSECYRIDDPLTKSDFEELSRQANDLTLKEMNQIIYSVSTLCRDHKQSWIHRRNLGWCFAQRIIAPVMHMHHDRQQVCPKPYMSVVYLLSTCDTISTISCPYSVICASSKHLNAFNSSSVVGTNFAILSQEAFLNTSYALILFNLYFFVR